MITALLVLLQAPASAAAPASTSAPGEKKICRTSVDTGSHVRRTRICRTRANWARVEENAREAGRGLQGLISTERGN